MYVRLSFEYTFQVCIYERLFAFMTSFFAGQFFSFKNAIIIKNLLVSTSSSKW